jgi:hypothetical protein
MKILNSNLKNLTYFAAETYILPIIKIVDKFLDKLIFTLSLSLSLIYIIQKFKISEVILIDFSKQLNSFNNNDLYIILQFFIVVLFVKIIKYKILISVNKHRNIYSPVSCSSEFISKIRG